MNEEYALLAPISEPLFSEVKRVKDFFREQTSFDYPSYKAPAHLTFCSFSMKGGRIEEVIQGLAGLVNGLKAIDLATAGIGGFMTSRTIFIKLMENKKYTEMQTHLNQGLRQRFPALKRHMAIASQPHITLGRGFDIPDYHKFLKMFCDPQPSVEFKLDKIQLMLKLDGKMKLYQTWSLPEL